MTDLEACAKLLGMRVERRLYKPPGSGWVDEFYVEDAVGRQYAGWVLAGALLEKLAEMEELPQVTDWGMEVYGNPRFSCIPRTASAGWGESAPAAIIACAAAVQRSREG